MRSSQWTDSIQLNELAQLLSQACDNWSDVTCTVWSDHPNMDHERFGMVDIHPDVCVRVEIVDELHASDDDVVVATRREAEHALCDNQDLDVFDDTVGHEHVANGARATVG